MKEWVRGCVSRVLDRGCDHLDFCFQREVIGVGPCLAVVSCAERLGGRVRVWEGGGG